MDLLSASLTEIRDSVRSQSIRAQDVARFFLERIEALDPKINSFISINPRAMDEARLVDEQIVAGQDPGPLAGVPIAIKDLLCTKGLRTTAGSRILSDFVPPYSATVVRRLHSAGAVNLGKTNLDEFAMGSSNETSAFGICRNPWDLDRVPGGSSGGSAAAVAARLAPAAIGTDTGGSIRQPASFCGIVGLKPTYGRVSRYGIIAYASSLDQAGPMARTSRDCALLLEAMAGHDEFDATSSQRAVPSWSTRANGTVRGVRVGILRESFSDAVDKATLATLAAARECLRDQGATITEVSLPMLKHAVPVYYLIATSEASSNLARYDGVRYGHRSARSAESLEEFYANNRCEGFGTEVKRRIMLGTYALSSGYYDAYYVKASQVRRLIRDEYMRTFNECDVILSPVTTTPAFKIGERISDPLTMYLNDIFTTSTNLAGLPGMSIPCGFSAEGLPIGVQATARPFEERTLFDLGEALESGLKLPSKVPYVV